MNCPVTNPAAVDPMTECPARLAKVFRDDSVHTDWDAHAGREPMARLMASDPGVDGVRAGPDGNAVGVLAALRAAGRTVPGGVAVIGFDDQGFAASTTLPLTTGRQPMPEEGRIAAELAPGMIDGESARTIVLDARFVEGSSV